MVDVGSTASPYARVSAWLPVRPQGEELGGVLQREGDIDVLQHGDSSMNQPFVRSQDAVYGLQLLDKPYRLVHYSARRA